MDFPIGNDDEGEGFVDPALVEITEKAIDSLRAIGLTVTEPSAMIDPTSGDVYLMLPCLVRKSAKKKISEDKQAREEFNRMMAAQNEQKILSEADKIRAMLKDPEKFFSAMDGEEVDFACAHTNVHPDGFCLDCNQGLE